MLRVLRNAHFDRVLEYPDEELCEDLLDPPDEVLNTRPDCPLPVTTEPLSCSKFSNFILYCITLWIESICSNGDHAHVCLI